MLKENTLFGTRDKVAEAIQRLKSFEPEDGYYVAFSGGKDSQCIYHLCEMAGVKFDAHYSVTSVDPPELVRFIKTQYPQVSFDIPHDKDGKPITMWNLIPKNKMPPTRLVRYCCAELKESSGKGRVTVTGVRWAESTNRKNNQGVVTIVDKNAKNELNANFLSTVKGGVVLNDDNDESRRVVEQCYRTRKTLVNPIIDWGTDDVWEFLNDVAKVPHCELYDQGYSRLGCIGCPMNANRKREIEKYSKHKAAYLRAFDRMIKERIQNGLKTVWTTPDEVMSWWLKETEPKKDGGLFEQEDEQ